jgi:hypothetical protein
MTEFLVGSLACLVVIALHTAVVGAVIVGAHRIARDATRHRFLRIVRSVLPSAVTLMGAHLLEIAVWATVYKLLGASNDGDASFYFAFVNYTTLGYGDVLPTSQWRLLGPMAAGCGILLFGLSTAALFEVLRQTALTMEGEDAATPATRRQP